MNKTVAFRVSAWAGFCAVALGAFGAHGLKELLLRNETSTIWETAAFYHLVHAVVLLYVAGREPFLRFAWIFFFAGVLIFSGTLYLLAVTNLRWLGAITPLGGVFLLGGWMSLAVARRS